MITNLDFLNKNTFRNYPIRQGATVLDNNGTVLPTFIIASISLTLSNTEAPYISQIALVNGSISVTISTSSSQVGYFQGILTQDYQTLNLVSTDGKSSGFLITGDLQNIQTINGVYSFNSIVQTGLEISTYISFISPPVTSINCRNAKLTGNIGIGTLINLTSTIDTNSYQLSVIDNSTILSIADKSSQFMNCDTPVITNINSVVPYPVAGYSDDANIYLMGINPVVFFNETDGETYSTINVATIDLDLTTFCTLNGTPLPPTDPNYLIGTLPGLVVGDDNGYNNYYSKSQTPIVNFLEKPGQEYLSWPYFVYTYSKVVANPVIGSYTVITPTGVNGAVTKIYAITDTGTVTFTLKVSSTSIGGLIGLDATDNGLVTLSTATNTFITTDSINFTVTATTGTPASLQLVVFYSQIFT